MKELVKETAKTIGVGTLIMIALLVIFALCSAMPTILNWLDHYIGTTMTWFVFIGAIIAFISWCVAE